MRVGDPKVFPWSEVVLAAEPLVRLEQERIRARLVSGAPSVKVLQPSRALHVVGRKFGISHMQLHKARALAVAAEADPERFGAFLAEADRTGKLDGPYKKLNLRRDGIRIRSLEPAAGRFRTLVMDAPWAEDNVSASAGHDYVTMSFPEILGLRDLVESWVDPSSFCHLWFWATNNTLGLAFQAVEQFGFRYKTVHTWTKPNIGLGRYSRNTTEHVLFAIRGGQGCDEAFTSTRTDHDWPVGANSEKPEAFFDMVRALSFPPYGEAFQRRPRPGFANLFPVALAAAEAAE